MPRSRGRHLAALAAARMDAADARAFQIPRALERRYEQSIQARVEAMHGALMRRLEPRLKRLVAEEEGERQDADASDVDGLLRIIESVGSAVDDTDPDVDELLTLADQINARQTRVLKRVIAIPRDTDLATATVQARWVRENVDLIKTIDARFFTEIESLVKETVGEGRQTSVLVKEIQRRFEVAESRARLIARDQIGKLNGQIAKAQQTKLGVTKYVWQTSEDERVREEHEARNGKTFKWSDPPSDGHPGEPIQCRCVALPVLDD